MLCQNPSLFFVKCNPSHRVSRPGALILFHIPYAHTLPVPHQLQSAFGMLLWSRTDLSSGSFPPSRPPPLVFFFFYQHFSSNSCFSELAIQCMTWSDLKAKGWLLWLYGVSEWRGGKGKGLEHGVIQQQYWHPQHPHIVRDEERMRVCVCVCEGVEGSRITQEE